MAVVQTIMTVTAMASTMQVSHVVMLADKGHPKAMTKVHPLVMFVGILSLVRVTIMVTVIDAILYLPVITTNTVIVTNVTTYSLVRVTIMVTAINAILYLPVITTNMVIVTNVTTYSAVKAINMVTAINVTTFGPVTQKITMAIVTMKAVIL